MKTQQQLRHKILKKLPALCTDSFTKYRLLLLKHPYSLEEDVKDKNRCYITHKDKEYRHNLTGQCSVIGNLVLEELRFHYPTHKDTSKQATKRQQNVGRAIIVDVECRCELLTQESKVEGNQQGDKAQHYGNTCCDIGCFLARHIMLLGKIGSNNFVE